MTNTRTGPVREASEASNELTTDHIDKQTLEAARTIFEHYFESIRALKDLEFDFYGTAPDGQFDGYHFPGEMPHYFETLADRTFRFTVQGNRTFEWRFAGMVNGMPTWGDCRMGSRLGKFKLSLGIRYHA